MSYVTWYNEIYIESTCLLFCFDRLMVHRCISNYEMYFRKIENYEKITTMEAPKTKLRIVYIDSRYQCV